MVSIQKSKLAEIKLHPRARKMIVSILKLTLLYSYQQSTMLTGGPANPSWTLLLKL